MRRLPALALLLLATPALAQPTGADAPVVVVAPFSALSGEVPARAGAKAAAILTTELKNADGLQPRTLAPEAGDPGEAQVASARALVTEAQAHWEARRLASADLALTTAIEAFRAASATEAGELADALALRAAVLYGQGRDEEADARLRAALVLAPGRPVALAQTSPLFSRVVERAREALGKGPRGNLQISSVPPGSTVVLDGEAVGATPLTIRDVPVGEHLWRVQFPSGQTAGGVAVVAERSPLQLHAKPDATSAQGALWAELADNRLDAAALQASRALAEAQGATVLVLGALSSAPEGLVLDAFGYFHPGQGLRRLGRFTFDRELLEAGAQLAGLAQRLSREGARAGEEVRLPATVSERPLAAALGPSEVRYRVAEVSADEPRSSSPPPVRAPLPAGPRTPLGKPKR
jgi:hypothetical protein